MVKLFGAALLALSLCLSVAMEAWVKQRAVADRVVTAIEDCLTYMKLGGTSDFRGVIQRDWGGSRWFSVYYRDLDKPVRVFDNHFTGSSGQLGCFLSGSKDLVASEANVETVLDWANDRLPASEGWKKEDKMTGQGLAHFRLASVPATLWLRRKDGYVAFDLSVCIEPCVEY